MPFTRRAIAAALFALTILPTFAQNSGAPNPSSAGQAQGDGAIVLPGPPPPEEKPLLDAIAANDEGRARAMRRAGMAGVAAGIIIAAAGFAVMYREAGTEPDIQAIHSGIGIVLSGALVAAISSAVARHPREGSRVSGKE